MNRYQKGKIYKLVNDADDEIYVGSSCLDLSKRFYFHKHASKTKGHVKVYKHLNTVGWDNVHIILVESFACSNKMELEKRERYWFDILSPSLNTNSVGLSDNERLTSVVKYKNNQRIKQCYKCTVCHTWVDNKTQLSHEKSEIHLRNIEKDAIWLKIASEGNDDKYKLCDACDGLISKKIHGPIKCQTSIRIM